jgi:hypothetical protein
MSRAVATGRREHFGLVLRPSDGSNFVPFTRAYYVSSGRSIDSDRSSKQVAISGGESRVHLYSLHAQCKSDDLDRQARFIRNEHSYSNTGDKRWHMAILSGTQQIRAQDSERNSANC